MGVLEAVSTCLRKYATFSGRAARPEYWWFALVVVALNIAATAADLTFFGVEMIEVERTESLADGTTRTMEMTAAQQSASPFALVVSLLTFLPFLAVGWRRLHDTGRSGWWLVAPNGAGLLTVVLSAAGFSVAPALGGALGLVLGLVILVLWILLIYWLASRGDTETNAYGPPPA
ncbi:DUF805 domain-containing protein [Rubrimonas cliftonensis]|uniref:Uncharacterized membrane protein YhaH, DUF805 family n=1 Tax=Rubrimonas cliftonensis TaxID=89524 RepID=A0A1H4EEB1_9RHOB|nr:DUF805 domain-containing protein [Rubrimonas cliftonensis]SEA82612.1 Uncharacterized membrane protein YhaH, DUF805 family [Rubrimonas cliftonensis]